VNSGFRRNMTEQLLVRRDRVAGMQTCYDSTANAFFAIV